MVRNLYLILVVGFRCVGLWLVARAVIGLLFATLLGRSFQGVLAPLISLAPSLVGGLLLWFLARWIAALIVKDLE